MELYDFKSKQTYKFEKHIDAIEKLLPFHGTVEQLVQMFLTDVEIDDIFQLLKSEKFYLLSWTLIENVDECFRNIFGKLDKEVLLINITGMDVKQAIYNHKEHPLFKDCIKCNELLKKMNDLNKKLSQLNLSTNIITSDIRIPRPNIYDIIDKYYGYC